MKQLTLIAIGAVAVFATACETSLQTTSGADYIGRYETGGYAPASTFSEVDAEVRAIAAVEPNLQFPARIGLARIDRGQLASIPPQEGLVWRESLSDLSPLYGEFVPISPLIAASVSKPMSEGQWRTGPAETLANIRRGAARQHVDYVLVYEAAGRASERSNALSVADLTVIGLFVLPSRSIDVKAYASGILMDVRNGYPYATLSAFSEKSGNTRAVSESSKAWKLENQATVAAVDNLASEFLVALDGLAERSIELAEARPSKPIKPATSPTTRALEQRGD